MTGQIRKITASRVPNFELANATVSDAQGNRVCYMSRDRTTVFAFGAGGTSPQAKTKLRQSTDDGVTWTDVYNFPVNVMGMVELDDGEVLVSGQNASNIPGFLYKSSGWQTNRTTATWKLVLTTDGGYILPMWNLHARSIGSNGVVVVNTYGSQTGTGGPEQAQTINAGRYVYVSQDFGATWKKVFDIYTSTAAFQPAGVHVHATAYDEEWDRIWLTLGDTTSSSWLTMRNGVSTNFPVMYSDDRGATWQWLPAPAEWNSGTVVQFTTVTVTKSALVFNTDGQPYGLSFFTRAGYRKLGSYHVAALLSGNTGTDIIGRAITKAHGPENWPMLATFTTHSTNPKFNPRIYISANDGLDFSELWVDPTNLVVGSGFYYVVGPTVSGKILGDYIYTGPSGTWVTAMLKADLIDLRSQANSSGGVTQVANGGVIPHELRAAPFMYSVNATVPNRAIAVTAVDATNLTISLTDLTGAAITAPENVAWTAFR
jgi:hypothetical protein